MNSVPSENIIALRKLTAEICNEGYEPEYRDVLREIKKLVSDPMLNKDRQINKVKIKGYESMCVTITNLLKEIKI